MNRSTFLFTAASAGVLVCAALAQAGIYSTLEPKWTLSGDYFRKFQEESLTPLKQLSSPEAKTEWQKYYQLAATGMLLAKDPLPTTKGTSQEFEDRLNLAICLLRVREPQKNMPEKATFVLKDLLRQDRDNFLVMSTLGSAYLVLGDYVSADANFGDAWRQWGKASPDQKEAWKIVNDAVAWQKTCDKSFSELKPERKKQIEKAFGWKEKDFAWFAKCELYQRHLVRLRMAEAKAESRKGPLGFSKSLERLDPLFDPYGAPANFKPVRFVSESGNFEPGKIAASEKAKLPDDAIEIVEQLLIWMPDDLRLFWLLGELFNAKGDVEAAKMIFDEFLGKFSQMPEFQGLKDFDPKTGEPVAIKPIKLLPKFIERHPEVGNRLKVLNEYANRPQEPGETPKEAQKDPATTPGAGTPDEPKQVVGASLNLDWKTLGVGLGAGAIVGFFVSWRLRDYLRRRQLRAAVRGVPSAPTSRGA